MLYLDAKNLFSGEVFSAYEILGPSPAEIDKISKPITAFNKKEPKKSKSAPVVDPDYTDKRERRSETSKKREYVESEEDDVPLAKRVKAKDKKKDKKIKSEYWCYAITVKV